MGDTKDVEIRNSSQQQRGRRVSNKVILPRNISFGQTPLCEPVTKVIFFSFLLIGDCKETDLSSNLSF